MLYCVLGRDPRQHSCRQMYGLQKRLSRARKKIRDLKSRQSGSREENKEERRIKADNMAET